MKSTNSFYTMLFAVGFATASFGNQPTLVDFPLKKAFVPIGFDDNDKVQAVVTGIFPDTCYRVGPYEVEVDQTNRTVTVKQQAYRYKGVCMDVTVPFAQVVEVGLLAGGDYKIQDAISGDELASVPVSRATTADPDNYLYAPISDAFISSDAGKQILNLNGNFSTRCMKLKEVKINYYPEAIVVQPIAEMIQAPRECTPAKVRFTSQTVLKAGITGTKLLHVRSIDGQAVNKIVDLQ